MTAVQWRSPGKRPAADFAEVAKRLRARPGVWALIDVPYGSLNSAVTTAANIRNGRIKAMASDFDAEARREDGENRVYARYVGDGGDREVPLLTLPEMDRAINDASDPYHLSYSELVQLVNRLIPVVPVEVAAQLCEVLKARRP